MACTPAPPLFWYKPESLPATAVPVASWPDSSGNGYDLTAVVGKEPVGDGEAIPGAVFDADDVLEGPTDVALNFGTGYTIFLVAKEPSSASHIFMGKFNLGTGSGWDLERYDIGFDNLAIYNSDFANPNRFYTDIFKECWPGAFDTSLHIYCIQMFQEGTVGSIRVIVRRDGFITDTIRVQGDNEHSPPTLPVATNEGAPGDWGKFTVGDLYGSATGIVGTIKEMLGYTGKLSDANVLLTTNYLRNKFTVSEPQRTYSVPVEIARASYTDTWAGIAAPVGTVAGDVEIMCARMKGDAANAIDFTPGNILAGVPWVSNLPVLTTSVVDTVNGGSVVIKFAFRVAQGPAETSSFQNAALANAPTLPCRIDIVTYRGLALGGVGAPYFGNNLPEAGFFYQDESENFDWTGFQYQPPVDHSADPVYAVHPNSMRYLIATNDVGVPTITSVVLPAGSSAQIVAGANPSWLLQAFVFEADSTADAPLAPPPCGDDTAAWVLPALEWTAAAIVAPLVPTGGTSARRFDAGLGLGVSYYLIPQLSDSDNNLRDKQVKAVRVTGKLTAANFKVYRYGATDPIVISDLEDGLNSITGPVALPDTDDVTASQRYQVNVPNAALHTVRIEGTWDGVGIKDRIDEVEYELAIQGIRR